MRDEDVPFVSAKKDVQVISEYLLCETAFPHFLQSGNTCAVFIVRCYSGENVCVLLCG